MPPSRPQVRIQTDPPQIFSKSNSTIEPETNQPSHGQSNEDRNERPASDMEKNTDVSDSSVHTDHKQPASKTMNLPQSLRWIPANSTWSKWKPVIRSALAAWIAVVVFIIPPIENILGQVCCVVIFVSFVQ